ncbi:DUF2510 domain-containing protein [Rhodococcus sp. ACT016]|uniref:DUF2510 domain-containing protein n=1 Tax=Rhodococcus sp. ACT016 TaxID=3134808 RepID=UPI003D29AE2D
MTNPAAPGWYPDPSGLHQLRYYDGTRWTEHTHSYAPQQPASAAVTLAGLYATTEKVFGALTIACLLLAAFLFVTEVRAGRISCGSVLDPQPDPSLLGAWACNDALTSRANWAGIAILVGAGFWIAGAVFSRSRKKLQAAGN